MGEKAEDIVFSKEAIAKLDMEKSSFGKGSEDMEDDEEVSKRETWGGRFDFFLSALGYAGK